MATAKKNGKSNGKSNGKAKVAKKKVVKAAAKKAAAKKMTGEGYKGHRPGTLKEKLHILFDKHGAEKARPLALKLEVAESTVNTSFSQFRKAGGGSRRASA